MDTFDSLIDQLESLGFFRYAVKDAVERAKAQTRPQGGFCPIGFDRDEMADAEDLAEGDVLETLKRVRWFLENQGVHLGSASQIIGQGTGYSVTVNGRTYEMYSEAELERNVPDIWLLTSLRFCALLSHLLTEAGSDERACCLYGGNDQVLLFLTDRQFDLLSHTRLIPAVEKPYR